MPTGARYVALCSECWSQDGSDIHGCKLTLSSQHKNGEDQNCGQQSLKEESLGNADARLELGDGVGDTFSRGNDGNKTSSSNASGLRSVKSERALLWEGGATNDLGGGEQASSEAADGTNEPQSQGYGGVEQSTSDTI